MSKKQSTKNKKINDSYKTNIKKIIEKYCKQNFSLNIALYVYFFNFLIRINIINYSFYAIGGYNSAD
jgi:hypothetical protein